MPLAQTLQSTHALFVNGFIFDELPGSVVMSAVACARKAGAATFFDPGPRAWTLRQGERKKAMDALLDASDVVLMTQVIPSPCCLKGAYCSAAEAWRYNHGLKQQPIFNSKLSKAKLEKSKLTGSRQACGTIVTTRYSDRKLKLWTEVV